MRYYAIGNCYLSSIQQGIQAFHTLGDMFVQYNRPELPVDDLLYTWAKTHKTMICLNGGNNAMLSEFYAFLRGTVSPFPYTKFHEDHASLNGTLTSIGIVVPEKIYEANLEEPDGSLVGWELELATRLRRMPLAR